MDAMPAVIFVAVSVALMALMVCGMSAQKLRDDALGRGLSIATAAQIVAACAAGEPSPHLLRPCD